MINQILQDSLIINQTEGYHWSRLPIDEVEDIILNCNEIDKIKFLIEENKTTFKVTGKTYDKLMEFVREFQDKIDWPYISIKQELSEDFIREFQDEVNWTYISIRQKLSEEFIREFQDKVNWYKICYWQNLSEDFVREFKNEVDLEWAVNYFLLKEKASHKQLRCFQGLILGQFLPYPQHI